MTEAPSARRSLVATAFAVVAATAGLAACTDDEDEGAPPTTTTAIEEPSCADGPAAPPDPGPGEMLVTVAFHCEADPDGPPVAFHRTVPSSPAVLTVALEQLLAGPTGGERARGATSWFGDATAGLEVTATVDAAGVATVDLDARLPESIPGASTSAGSAQLLAELDATVFAFPSVTSVTYRLEGECEAFASWLQQAGCVASPRPGPVGEA